MTATKPAKGRNEEPMGKRESQRILYVEDDQDSQEIMTTLLAIAGYEVTPAGSVAEGLELARHRHFSLIILDSQLSDGTGIGLCQQIRAFDRRTPILFYAGASNEADILEARNAGAQEFLIKPIGIEALEQTVQRLTQTKNRR